MFSESQKTEVHSIPSAMVSGGADAHNVMGFGIPSFRKDCSLPGLNRFLVCIVMCFTKIPLTVPFVYIYMRRACPVPPALRAHLYTKALGILTTATNMRMGNVPIGRGGGLNCYLGTWNLARPGFQYLTYVSGTCTCT